MTIKDEMSMNEQKHVMPIDREAVIRELTQHIARADYIETVWMDCVSVPMLRGALELLKEQEPVKPKIEKSVAKIAEETIEISVANCGNCGALIEQPVANESGWNYCPKCGKAVNWDDD